MATCKFVNVSDDPVYVSVWYSGGGVSNSELRKRGDEWDLHVSDGDKYCWDKIRPCEEGTFNCQPGETYDVG